MKKSVLLALAAMAIVGTSTATAQEVTYVEDCSQGLLMNRNADNWFLTARGGTNILFSDYDIDAPLKDRFGGNAALFVGKWVNPNFGFRFGGSWMMPKGATLANGLFYKQNQGKFEGKDTYPEKFMAVGPEFDVLINLTNWWCGYRPGRVYNAVVHGGAGAYWTFREAYDKGTDQNFCWRRAHETRMFANVGLQNNFRVSKHVELFVDFQYDVINFSNFNSDLEINAGLNINFGKTTWNCPVTAVCPTWKYTDAEGDALVARLANAQNEINSLKQQLVQSQNRADRGRSSREDCEGVVTIYYPINQYSLSARERNILNSMADVMKNNEGVQYELTGWADNFTGTPEYNEALRNKRVDGVKTYLLERGVAESQMNVNIDNGSLSDIDNVVAAPLDRAVTIRKK